MPTPPRKRGPLPLAEKHFLKQRVSQVAGLFTSDEMDMIAAAARPFVKDEVNFHDPVAQVISKFRADETPYPEALDNLLTSERWILSFVLCAKPDGPAGAISACCADPAWVEAAVEGYIQ